MAVLLKIDKIEKYYGAKTYITKAIDCLSFEVIAGEFVGIMGASGSGKSTLLNCISTIDKVTAGHIYLDGTDITTMKDDELAEFRQKNLGFVFQDFNLLDTLTVEENIALAPVINRYGSADIDKQVSQITARLGIADVLKKFPYEISGGQRQRCACARALVSHPKMILADEPTGALDSKSAGMLLESLSEVNQQMGATILMVTHDLFSASYCQRILFLKDGQIFNEIRRGEKSRREFFLDIVNVETLLGGDGTNAL